MSARAANLLGALGLVATDRVRDATGYETSTAAAIVSLQTMAGGGSIDELRRVLGLSHSGGVRIVARLRAAGLVEQRRDPVDGRAVRLRLTPAGSRLATRLRSERLAVLDALLDPLDEQQRDQLEALLGAVLAGATAARSDARRICRQCDPDVCGHPARCPVTQAAAELHRRA